MKVAIVGPGNIGSTFALHLVRAGHDVTVIARGARLAFLQRERAIVTSDGERAAVDVSDALDVAVAYDLVLVTVLAHQVDAVLPALSQSAASSVMFMFNTFEPLDRLRDAVGAGRFSFGFPAILATLRDQHLASRVVPGTTASDARFAKVFTDAGIRTVVEADMHSWLRTHAALVAPFMAMSNVVAARGAGVSIDEARACADALVEGFDVVRALGNAVTPTPVRLLGALPRFLLTTLFWAMSRLSLVRDLGAQGPAEPRALIDAMAAAAPGQTPRLLSLRP